MPQFDRRAIREVQARYARALDRGDAVLLASTFWPGATVDLPTYQGDFEGLAAALDTPRFRGVRHVVSNELFTFDTGRCHAELYLQDQYMWNAADEVEGMEPDEVKPEWKLHSLVARYLDLLEKRGNEWRFLSRRLIYDWSRAITVPANLMTIAPESPRSIVPTRTGSYGVRDPVAFTEAQRRDPSYALLHTSNLLRGPDNRLTQREEIIVKAAIEDMLFFYARHVDRLDMEHVGQMFWPEADIAIAGFTGNLSEYLVWLTKFTQNTVARSHNIFNPLVVITSPSTAVSECYLDAHNIRKSKSNGEEDRWGYGRYVDSWQKRNGVWKMISRKLINDFGRIIPHKPPAHAEASMKRAGGLDDPSFSILSSNTSSFNVPATEDVMMARIADRDEIVQILHLYCRTVDRFDDRQLGWESNGTGEIFHPDAVCDFGKPAGPIDTFIPALMQGVRHAHCNQHILSNVIVTFASSTQATSESYVSARRLIKGSKGIKDRTMAGRYLDKWEKRQGKWKIVYRTLVLDWIRIEDMHEIDADNWRGNPGKKAKIVWGDRGTGNDPSFRFLLPESKMKL